MTTAEIRNINEDIDNTNNNSICPLCNNNFVHVGDVYCRKCAPNGVGICEECGETYIKRSKNSRFCNNGCAKKYRLKMRRRDKRHKLTTYGKSVCEICNKEFVMYSTNQKYCSPECGSIAQDIATNKGRIIIFSRDAYKCIYCGRTSYGDNAKLHVDHIMPRSEGGEDVASNLVTACERCNLEKHAKVLPNIDKITAEIKFRNGFVGLHDDTKIKIR